jgi:hypothetical protein
MADTPKPMPESRDELLAVLEAMPGFLESAFAGLSAAQAVAPGPDGTFSPVEQCWHLADLEREGYGSRIRRLLAETHPALPDFDGARFARERNYRALALADGLGAFRAARHVNLVLLRSIPEDAWSRAGTQEGRGPVALGDLPAMMAAHDGSHREEIEAWLRQRNR